MEGSIRAFRNANDVRFGRSNPSAGGSFARANLKLFLATPSAAGNGVVFQDGVYLYDGDLHIFGNFSSDDTGPDSGAVISFQGGSRITASIVQVGVEITTKKTYVPMSIRFADSTSAIANCTGILRWEGGFAATNLPAGLIGYSGKVINGGFPQQ
jgi:hypothetical protein